MDLIVWLHQGFDRTARHRVLDKYRVKDATWRLSVVKSVEIADIFSSLSRSHPGRRLPWQVSPTFGISVVCLDDLIWHRRLANPARAEEKDSIQSDGSAITSTLCDAHTETKLVTPKDAPMLTSPRICLNGVLGSVGIYRVPGSTCQCILISCDSTPCHPIGVNVKPVFQVQMLNKCEKPPQARVISRHPAWM